MHKKIFGCNVFDNKLLKKLVLPNCYNAIVNMQQSGKVAQQRFLQTYARKLSRWAVKKGATHYCHWCVTNDGNVGKRNNLFCLDGKGKKHLRFRAKDLLSTQMDASSIACGDICRTHDALGVATWLGTAPFIVGDCLVLPCKLNASANVALDDKTALKNSVDALDKQATRLLNKLGFSTQSVRSSVGVEQEFFLLDKTLFDKRPDLVANDCAFFGKANVQSAQYLSLLDDKVTQYFCQVDKTLDKLGILLTTQHHENAPCQYEVALCYTACDVACGQNAVVMQVLSDVAQKFNLKCIFTEKPFDCVSGSGKHDNWSLLTSDNVNLLDKGKNAMQNALFLVFLTAIVMALDDYGDVILASVSNYQNDKRLGACEAPPQIASMCVGNAVAVGVQGVIDGSLTLGKDVLFGNDDDFRNRTSPICYAGNKIEVRLVGASSTVEQTNVALNCAVASSLQSICQQIAEGNDVWQSVQRVVSQQWKLHGKVVYDGNCYDKQWQQKAKQTLFFADGVTVHDAWTANKNVSMFETLGVYSQKELQAKRLFWLQNYSTQLQNECNVAIQMCNDQIAQSVNAYAQALQQRAQNNQLLGVDCAEQKLALETLQKAYDAVKNTATALDDVLQKSNDDHAQRAQYLQQNALPLLRKLGKDVTALSCLVPTDCWTMPSVNQLLGLC